MSFRFESDARFFVSREDEFSGDRLSLEEKGRAGQLNQINLVGAQGAGQLIEKRQMKLERLGFCQGISKKVTDVDVA